VFSFVSRCQGLGGSQKYTRTPPLAKIETCQHSIADKGLRPAYRDTAVVLPEFGW
jgi:hypothetical protein